MKHERLVVVLALFGLGLAARVAVWWVKGGFHYPDEIMQYLEPANFQLTGTAWLPWEFERGVRNWLLPSFYVPLIALGRKFGLDGFAIQRWICLHNALWSLLLIPATYRIAYVLALPRETNSATWAGRLSALFAALYLPLVYYMPHTLNEVPGVLLTTWAMVFFAEQSLASDHSSSSKRALYCGLALGAATVIRPTLGLWAVIPGLFWLMQKHKRWVAFYLAGALLLVFFGGLVDWFTWGDFLHSTLEYVDYNLIEKGASHHGVSPWYFYAETWFWKRLGFGAVALIALSALVAWRVRQVIWLIVAAIFPVLVLSLIEHKEERFVLSSLPLLTSAAALGGATLLAWTQTKSTRILALVGVVAATLFIFFTGTLGVQDLPWRWRAGIFAGQRYVGHQADASGVLLDDRLHLNGGYLILDRNIPQLSFSPYLARQSLFNYLVIRTDSMDAHWATHNGFKPLRTFDDMTVFKRN